MPPTAKTLWKIVWKTFAVTAAIALGGVGANQAGWSAAKLIVQGPYLGIFEDFLAGLFFSLGTAASIGAFYFIDRIAKPALWLLLPVFLYGGLVLGVWNGYAGDFDATRLAVVRNHFANAYALEHMSERARYRSCTDDQIQLAEDAKPVCAAALTAAPGENIPGSEHRCGFLEMLTCFNSAPENTKPQHQ